MRLAILKTGLSWPQKLQAGLIHRMMRYVPGPIYLLSYRKRFFGRPFSRLIQEVLRKAEHWSVGELELMGAFCSAKNACQMCLNDHSAVAALAMDPEKMQAVLDDYRTAPIDARLRTTLAFLEKLSLEPAKMTAADLRAMRAAGLSDAAIEEAAEVCMIFASMNRLVDAFDFEIGPDPAKAGRFLLKNGYAVACLRG